MICKCGNKGVFVQWESFGTVHEYWYCRTCKEEIELEEVNGHQLSQSLKEAQDELEKAFEDLLKTGSDSSIAGTKKYVDNHIFTDEDLLNLDDIARATSQASNGNSAATYQDTLDYDFKYYY